MIILIVELPDGWGISPMLGAKVRTYCEESNIKGERFDVLVFLELLVLLDVLGLLEFLVF